MSRRHAAMAQAHGGAADRALPPMEYLLAWRMAAAKDLFRRHDLGLTDVAERVGYGSASSFSTAFSRHVGRPPGRYARESRREAISA
jgi:AraC-like DNA-binding protein